MKMVEKVLKLFLCFLLSVVMLHPSVTQVSAETAFDSGLLKNGTFVDANADGKADDWSYYKGSVTEAPSSVGIDGLTITADSSSGAQRLTVHQTVSGLTVGKTYRLTGEYNVISTGSGSLEIRHDNATDNDTKRFAYHTSKTNGVQQIDKEVVATKETMKIEIVVSQGAILTATVNKLKLVEVVAEPEPTPTPVPAFDSGLLGNGGFAYETGAATATGWQYWTSGTTVLPAIEQIENGLKITSAGTNAQGTQERVTLQRNTNTLEIGETYVISGAFQVENCTSGKFSIDVNGLVTPVSLQTNSDGWKTFEAEFTATSTAHQVRVMTSAGAKMTASVKELKVVLKATPTPTPTFDSGLLENGGFSDVVEGYTGNYNKAEDGKAAAWQYWTNTKEPKTELIANGIKIEALSKTNGSAERVTIQQTVSGLESGKKYKLSGKYEVISTASGSFTIDVNGVTTIATHTSKTNGEQTFETEFTATGTSHQIRIAVSNGAELTATVKEFMLEEVVEVSVFDDGLLINGGFADVVEGYTGSYNKAEDQKAAAWQYWTSGTTVLPTIELIKNGLTIKMKGVGAESKSERTSLLHTVNDLEVGASYVLTGSYKVEDYEKDSFAIDVKGLSQAVKVSANTDGWQTFTYTFTATATSHEIRVICNAGGIYTASVKEFKLVKTSEAPFDGGLLINPLYADVSNDGKADSWNYYSNKGDSANYEASSKDGVFTATMKGTGTLILHQTVALGASGVNKKYRFTGEVKVNDLSTDSYASFRIQLVDSSNKGLGTTESDRVKGTSEWVPVTIDFEVPEESAGKSVAGIKVEHYINGGTGTVEFRKVKLVETGVMENLPEGDPLDTLIYNGGYEKTASGMPASWSLWQSTGGMKATSDRAVKYEGYSSMHLEEVTAGSNSRGSVHQTFTVTESLSYLTGNALKISQWVKTSGFVGSGVSIRIHDPANTLGTGTVVATKTIPLNATQEWTYYEYILDLPSYPLATIKVEYLYDSCQGDVWIDNTLVSGYVRATGIEVKDEPIILSAGSEYQLELSFTPNNATVKDVEFKNSDDTVITVDENGLVKALKNGTSVITITQIDGIKKEVGVLVCDTELEFNETITITTKQNEKKTGELPSGYVYKTAAAAQHGTFLIEGETGYIYYPDKDYVGSDTVTLFVEKDGAQTLYTVSLTVTAVNAAPECASFNILTNVNESATGKITATDPENDAIVFEVATQPAHGTLTISGANYTFVPEADFTGSDTAIIHAKDEKNTTSVEVKIYVAADVADLLNTVKDEHSRLLADDARFEELKRLIVADENAKVWFEELKDSLDPLLSDTTPVPFETPDGLRLNTQGSKDVLNMAFMYRMTGDERYFDRACLELNSLCNIYPDWNPVHLLDTAMTANGVAIAYDWLYEALKEKTPDLLNDVENALIKFGLQEAKKQFEANHMFVTNLNNWNYVCNGGFVTTALALAHHEDETVANLAGEIMQRCYKSIQYGLPQYAPEGDSIEGISYWDYGTRYLVSCLASISSATTVDNPFVNAAGLYETAQYPIYMTGKAGTYNYSDNDMTPSWGYLNLWLANEYNEPAYTWYHKDYVANGGEISIYDLLYYYPEQYEADAPEQLDRYYTSQAVTTMRTDFEDENTSFLGFKGGLNGAAHGDLDIGSFVYDIYGERWAFDFGKEDYNLSGYWEIVSGGTRWNYYRKNAMGHNTLIINPEDGANQIVGAYSGAIEQVLNQNDGGYTILDMTSAYEKNAVDVKRGFAYIDRTQVLIRDEFTLKSAGDVYWQMHTEASVTISEDGKTAVLTQNGKSIEARLLDGEGLKFETMEAKPYEGLTTYEGENPNTGVTKLYVKSENVQQGSISVLLTPAEENSCNVLPLNQWANATADYTAVNEVIETIPAELSQYTDETVAQLNAVLASVNDDKKFYSQNAVDAYAEAIADAIAALEKKTVEDEGVESKIEISVDLSDVAEELGFESTEELMNEMLNVLITELEFEYKDDNLVALNAVLKVSFDDGQTWVVADKDHWPEDGMVLISLTYEELSAFAGVELNSEYKYVVSHMFTSDAFGKTPGDVETPAVTKTATGIKFYVTGLSPIMIGWSEQETAIEPVPTPTPTTPVVPETPNTGDTTSIAGWAMMAGLALFAALVLRKKRTQFYS